MFSDLDLTGNRYSVSIFIFTVASVCCQLPATILLRFAGREYSSQQRPVLLEPLLCALRLSAAGKK